MSWTTYWTLLLLASAAPLPATPAPSPAAAEQIRVRRAPPLERRAWTIEEQERIALLHVPPAASQSDTPVLFAFHGHGGSARQASRSFRMHAVWPEAIVVYMEGLPTPGLLTDPEGKRNGWQSRAGLQNDRDLKFFDAVLATLGKEYKIDRRRIYAMGHSNGGGFTYLLWRERPDAFAAFAPSGAFTLRVGDLKPRPAMHIAGMNDELVKFERQEQTIAAVKELNGCNDNGEPWASDCTLYPSRTGTPLVTYIHDGTHKFPSAAPPLIARFFKEHAQPESADAGNRPPP
ncbi:MAG: hypothetical protein CHACPFDD_02064 [Phycisphaerae bacterium]|nr:hypothetical protein [Phycisphaerae bacterium]